jgi:nitrogenase molybdenum-iron protein alpha/beta subunit
MTKSDDEHVDFTIPYRFASPYLDGVYLVVNAVPDACLVYDAHDCGYYKAEKIAGTHDLFSELLRWDQSHRVMRTNVEMSDYIMGSEDKLSKRLLQVLEHQSPGIVFVARSNPIVVSGHDATAVMRDVGEKTGTPLVLMPDRNLERDYITGYLDALEGLIARLAPRKPRSKTKSVVLAGYVFDRNEGDHRGNVEELRRMVHGIGGKPTEVLLDGTPFAKLNKLQKPALVVDLANGWKGASDLARRCSSEYLSAGLPLGIQGTVDWIRSVGRALDLNDRAAEFIQSEVSELARMLEWLQPRFFAGKRALLFADRLLIGPLGRFLEELGLLVAGVGCTSEDTGAEAAWPQVPAHIPQLEDFLIDSYRSSQIDLIVGNSVIRQTARGVAVPFVEVGYPSNFHHVLRPAPILGFCGVRVLVERMLNAMYRTHLQTSAAPTENIDEHGDA